MLYTFNNILVCTDFSERSTEALIAAELLKKETGGHITLLHVSALGLKLDEGDLVVPTLKQSVLGGFKKQIKEKMREQATKANSDSLTFLIKEGNVAETILSLLDKENYEILFIGHGTKSKLHNLLGSVAKKIIAKAPVPVMVVKRPPRNNKVIGCISDTGPIDRIINQTLDYFRSSKAKELEFISLGHGAELKDKIVSDVEYFIHEPEHPTIKIEDPLVYNTAYDIAGMLEREMADVAVLKKNNINFPRRLFLNSTTAKIIDIFPGNVLIFPS